MIAKAIDNKNDKKPKSRGDIKNIIVSRTDKIGDLLLSIPSLFMVKKMYPKAKLTVLVRNYNYIVIKNLPYVDEVIEVDSLEKGELIQRVKGIAPEIFVALYSDQLILRLALVSGARKRIGPRSKPLSFLVYNKGIRQKRSKSIKNEAEYNLDLVKKINPLLFNEYFELNSRVYLGKEELFYGKSFFKANNLERPTLIINPFTGGSAKTISDSQYRDLIKAILAETNKLNILLTCHESEREPMNKLAKGLGERVKTFVNQKDLLTLAGVFKEGDLYFGGSTGPTHLAAAVGIPIIGLYPNKATQHPKRWGAFNASNVTYIIPDRDNSNEDYSHKVFDSYSKVHEEEIVSVIIKKLKEVGYEI